MTTDKITPKTAKTETAIILRRVDHLLFSAIEVTLQGNKIISERELTRAPDSLSMAKAKAVEALSRNIR